MPPNPQDTSEYTGLHHAFPFTMTGDHGDSIFSPWIEEARQTDTMSICLSSCKDWGPAFVPSLNTDHWKYYWYSFSNMETSGAVCPQVGNPMFVGKKIRFILHFRTLGTFLVFTKMFTFWVVLWFVEVGMGDPPSKEKFPLYLVFFDLFTERALGDPKQN